jgi:methyl-accepting chemotaxis protein
LILRFKEKTVMPVASPPVKSHVAVRKSASASNAVKSNAERREATSSSGSTNTTALPTESIAGNAVVLDLAGRQRMLNQRHVKLVLARMLGVNVPLESVRTLLQETVCALANGGPAVVKPGANPTMAMLPPAPTPEIHDKILEQEQLLCRVETLADQLLQMDASDPERAANIKSLVDEGDQLHGVADAAVAMFSAHFTAIAVAEQAAKERLSADISESSQQLTGMAQVFAETSTTLAQNTQQQAATIAQISADVEALERTIVEIAKSAKAATETAAEANRLAAEGGQAVGKNIEAMTLINQSSNRIAKVLEVVSEIASQTNLLALNATIEAARAGIHGQAFAVVAEEVRKLAQRAAQSAKEISGLVQESNERVKVGVSLSEQANKVIRQIIDGVSTTSSGIAEIALATESQSATSKGVATAVKSLSEMTEGNAAATEELAASAEELSSRASTLLEMAKQ